MVDVGALESPIVAEIALDRHGLAGELLRRHISRRPGKHLGALDLAHQRGQAEVGDARAAATVEQLWELRLPSSVEATPITYLGADGRQFVTVVSTGGGLTGSEVTNDEIIAFALPMN